MDANKIKEAIIRSEGFSEGFKMGYLSCAQFIIAEMEKETSNEPQK